MISTIILAAGESTRMGEPKALVHFGETTFLETIISNFKDAGFDYILVVLGSDAEKIIKIAKLSSVQIVINEQFKSGQFSSFQTGVRNSGQNIEGVFLALVDQPQIGTHIIRKMLKVFHENPEKIVIPTYKGKRGHPTIFPKTFFPVILSHSPKSTAAEIIHRHANQVIETEVDDECILWNINTKQDLEVVRKYLRK